MKKFSLVLAFFLVGLFLVPGSAFSYPDVYLKEVTVNPGSAGTFMFPELGKQSALYGQYNLAIDWDAAGPISFSDISGFCVDPAWAPTGNKDLFTLYDVSKLGLQYKQAAWVYDKYLNDQISAQAAQLVIWEVVFDFGKPKMDLNSGEFYVIAAKDGVEEAAKWLGSGIGSIAGDDYWVAADSDPIKLGIGKQDYIIRKPVSEPATMLLLGAGLIGLAAFGRKNLLKKV